MSNDNAHFQDLNGIQFVIYSLENMVIVIPHGGPGLGLLMELPGDE